MSPKFAQFLKWVGLVDAAVFAGASAFGAAYPPAGHVVLIIIALCGGVSAAAATVAHLGYGSQTVPGNPLELEKENK